MQCGVRNIQKVFEKNCLMMRRHPIKKKTENVLEKRKTVLQYFILCNSETFFRDVKLQNTKQIPIQPVSEFLETRLLLSLNRFLFTLAVFFLLLLMFARVVALSILLVELSGISCAALRMKGY